MTAGSPLARGLRGKFGGVLSTLLRLLLLALIAVSAGLATTLSASAETRSLKLYYIHTKEKAEIVFKRNGRYDQAGLNKLNRFLRDWRRNEPTKMDPRLFDLVWEVYHQANASGYINVVSAYRSPATNDMLRRTRGGQAKKSQHMVGKAMDFFIPGVKLSKLRGIAMKLQGGGVGYYPKSGSPFVHLDVASVRAWPRMSRQELVQLFPNGKTLHLPPDGKPLPGYQVALADYKKRGGAIVSSSSGGNNSSRSGGGLLAALFGGGDEDEEPEAIAAAPKPAPAPARTEVAALPGVPESAAVVTPPAPVVAALPSLPASAPIPMARPVLEQPTVVAALVPPAPVLPAQDEVNAFAAAANADVIAPPEAIVDYSKIRAPVPQLLAERAFKPEPAQPAAAVEIAALSQPDPIQARMLAAATLPVEKPQVALPAAKVPSTTDVPVPVPPVAVAPALAPASTTEIAALPSGEDFVPLPIRRPGDRPNDRVMAPAAIELASLAPVPGKRGGRPSPAHSVTTAKGDRPTAASAAEQPQRTAIRTEPKLTETIISSWALAQERVQTMPTSPGKARHFVAQQLRAAPTVVYANGFAPGGGELPHNQFTGSAVNFISVARFGN
ncbi:DUF882 domain-containing protein [Hoeflea sp. G2-23]|uniref:Murein endopeptidase K n=1 Tax=Hoeflea algicola TaxID=2983763 RepID=A0ABT3Z907_9HYPH|nr:DUF882 domain-containing protein [Hoeflea algicola]MCY0148265.1 DUF882 domain-containing protein [Hoeflea algicola]